MSLFVEAAESTQPTPLEVCECKYCSTLFGSQHHKANNQPWNEILWESDNFVIVPTLGAIVEGWLLIISKEHYVCMGAIEKDLHTELEEAINLAATAVSSLYGRSTIFEHGPCQQGLELGCGIDHAHMHVLPLQFNLRNAAKMSPEMGMFDWVQVESTFCQLSQLHRLGASYMYIQEQGKPGYYCMAKQAPCQSLRRIIARKLDVAERYDYNKYPFRENVANTIARMKQVFRSDTGDCPLNIAEWK